MHKNNTKLLLKIQGFSSKFLYSDEKNIHYHIKNDKSIQICPSCKFNTDKIHSYIKESKIKHIMIDNKQVILHINKRRYVCKHCGKVFIEQYSFIQKYFRITNDCINNIINSLSKKHSIKDIADTYNTSSNQVIRLMRLLSIEHHITKLPTHIGIDEFRGNSGGEKFQVVITDLNTKRVVDIIQSRSFNTLERYFSKISNLKDVELVTMDMCPLFRSIVKAKFKKDITIVADKFHYTRLITWGLENVRKRVQNKLDSKTRLFFKHSKKLLNARYDLLSLENKFVVDRMLAFSEDLMYAHAIKEYFYEINDESDFETKKLLFKNLLKYMEDSLLPEFKSHTNSMRSWIKEIYNSFNSNYTNAVTEGLNNSIKVLKRTSYGFRSFDIFRLRILNCLS